MPREISIIKIEAEVNLQGNLREFNKLKNNLCAIATITRYVIDTLDMFVVLFRNGTNSTFKTRLRLILHLKHD